MKKQSKITNLKHALSTLKLHFEPTTHLLSKHYPSGSAPQKYAQYSPCTKFQRNFDKTCGVAGWNLPCALFRNASNSATAAVLRCTAAAVRPQLIVPNRQPATSCAMLCCRLRYLREQASRANLVYASVVRVRSNEHSRCDAARTPKQLQLRRGADRWRRPWRKRKRTPRAMTACHTPRCRVDAAAAA